MPDQDAFLQAPIDDPYDTALAGVFADWLDERGDPRGEFLRVQTALAHWQPPRLRQKLAHRNEELLRRHNRDWLGPLGDLGPVSFERGLATIEVPAVQLIGPLARNAAEWTRQAWVRWVRPL